MGLEPPQSQTPRRSCSVAGHTPPEREYLYAPRRVPVHFPSVPMYVPVRFPSVSPCRAPGLCVEDFPMRTMAEPVLRAAHQEPPEATCGSHGNVRIHTLRGWRSPRRFAAGWPPRCGRGGRARQRTSTRLRTLCRISTVAYCVVGGPGVWLKEVKLKRARPITATAARARAC